MVILYYFCVRFPIASSPWEVRWTSKTRSVEESQRSFATALCSSTAIMSATRSRRCAVASQRISLCASSFCVCLRGSDIGADWKIMTKNRLGAVKYAGVKNKNNDESALIRKSQILFPTSHMRLFFKWLLISCIPLWDTACTVSI